MSRHNLRILVRARSPTVMDTVIFGRIAAVLLFLVFLEHIGRKNNCWWIRVSMYMSAVFSAVSPWALKIGCILADILMFVNILDLWELCITVEAIVIPAYQLITVWSFMFDGFDARLRQFGSEYVLFVAPATAVCLWVLFETNVSAGLFASALIVGAAVSQVYTNWSTENPTNTPPPIEETVVLVLDSPPPQRRARRRANKF
jgi:hypothetical protein